MEISRKEHAERGGAVTACSRVIKDCGSRAPGSNPVEERIGLVPVLYLHVMQSCGSFLIGRLIDNLDNYRVTLNTRPVNISHSPKSGFD